MSDLKIRQLFEARLAAWATARSPTLTIAYEDKAFTVPANGGTYLKAFLMPGAPASEDLAGRHISYRGLFQVSVITKAGIGRGPAGLIAEELAALFPNNQELTRAGFSVFVRSPMGSAAAIQDDTVSMLPLRFRYRADTF